MTSSFRRFGQYETLLLCDGVFEPPSDVLMHIDGAAAGQKAVEAWGKPTLRIDVNCFALRGPNGITLIDSGTGNVWGPAFGHARAAMRDAGIGADQVDRVVLTHIHGDHALGLFEGDAPYFPRAEVLVPESDFAFFTDASAREATPEAKRGGFDIAEQLQRVYGARLRKIPSFGLVVPGIEAHPLPGHTPGHTGYLVHGQDGSLLIWGDTLHVADLQAADPKVGLIYDTDPPIAALTRQATLEHAVREGWIVAGSHVSGFNRVHRIGDGFQIVAV